MTCVRAGSSEARRPQHAGPEREREVGLPDAIIDGITTRYEMRGAGAPLLMFSPGGFDATLEKWTTLGVYARINVLDPPMRVRSCSSAASGLVRPCSSTTVLAGCRCQSVRWRKLTK